MTKKLDFLFFFWLQYVKRLELITLLLNSREKNLNKLKINDFFWIHRRLKLQSKVPLGNLEKQVNSESRSQDLLPWSRSHRNNTLE